MPSVMDGAGLALWAKLPRSNEAAGYHPLPCHLLDVAAVTTVLWAETLGLAARRHLAEQLGLDEDAAGRWAAFWAGSHDIGKAAPAFQFMEVRPPARRQAIRVRLQQDGLIGRPPIGDKVPHGTISAEVLRSLLVEIGQMQPPDAKCMADAIGGHHGVFPKLSPSKPIPPDAKGSGRWQEIRRELIRQLAAIIALPAPPTALPLPAAIWVAGLISVADWIGSNEEYFPYMALDSSAPPALDLVDYWRVAQSRASDALTRLGWITGLPVGEGTFPALFPQITAPRPLQAAAIARAPELAAPSLVIVEAPMGEGKTEAALFLADQADVRHGQHGCYVALPTRATSDQMFGRVKRFLQHRYAGAALPAELQLLHGQAELSGEFAALGADGNRLFIASDIAPDEANLGEAPSVIASEWFTNRKRGLLSPFGVGTIDQALLAVLQIKHGFVRLFGLSHKVVIVDEAHAYDIYMTTLLERLLAWLGALQTSVVILSATLPAARCRQLIDAYAGGVGSTRSAPELAAYPRLSWWSPAGAGSTEIATSDASIKSVRVEWVDGRLPEDGADRFPFGDRLADLLTDGGCVAVICNTVDRAQRMYRALRRSFAEHFPDHPPRLDLLHARFPFSDREQREQRALRAFGPGDDDRPIAAVLVSTQVIEQSLDLDFDHLITDLAPVDFVLQRIGRLHRHQRGHRPERLREPVVWICAPEATPEAVPHFDPGTAAVYDKHILLRSFLTLRDRAEIAIPGDVSALIEAVYDDREPAVDLTPALTAYWIETRDRLRREQGDDQQQAKDRWVKNPNSDSPIWKMTEGQLTEDEAATVHPAFQALTRLSDGPSVDVICLYGDSKRPTLDPEGRRPVKLSHPPTVAAAKELLRRSVRISRRGTVEKLLALAVPSGWQRSPLLRQHRLVTFDRNGDSTVENVPMRWESDLGIVLPRRVKGEIA